MRTWSIIFLWLVFAGVAVPDTGGQQTLRDFVNKGEKLRKSFRWSKADMTDPRIRALISCNWSSFAGTAFTNEIADQFTFKGVSYLYLAVAAGCPEFIHELVARGMNVNEVPDTIDYSLLHAAIWSGNDAVVSALLEAGARLEYRWRGYTPLHVAIQRKNMEITGLLLEKGADVNARTPSLQTPLILAIDNKYPEIALAILARNPDVNERDVHDDTALHLAARNQKPELISALIGKGADIEARDKNGRTPIMRAANNCNVQAVRVLLEAGADIKAMDNYRRAVIFYCLQDNASGLLDLLIHAGADVDIQSQRGWTLLHEAAREGSVDPFRWLLNHGLDINVADDFGRTPVYTAVLNQKEKSLRELALLGADLNKPDSSGYTPLFVSFYGNNPNLSKILVDGGADIHKTGPDGFPNLWAAAAKSSPAHISVLLHAGVDPSDFKRYYHSPLYAAFNYRKFENFKYLLDYGLDPDVHAFSKWPVILDVCWDDQVEYLRELLDHGADPNWASLLNHQTPLITAARRGSLGSVALLLERGADPSRRVRGFTAWHSAVMGRNTNVAEILASRMASRDMMPTNKVTIYFDLDAPWATNICVIGSFNEWTENWDVMHRREDDGWWYAEVSTFPGKHTYKYVVDGVHQLDPNNSDTDRDSNFGHINNRFHTKYRLVDKRPSKKPSIADDFLPVTLAYSNRAATNVVVSGEFNEWSTAHYMTPHINGWWKTTVRLRPGDYAYKFVVDDAWILDPANPDRKKLDGVVNSRLHVGN